jgi:hypothetical protein
MRPLIQGQVHVRIAHEIGIAQLGLVNIIDWEVSNINLLPLEISPDW